MKDYLPGNFIKISHDRKVREAEIKRQEARTLETMVTYCLLVPSAAPVVIYSPKSPTKKQLKNYIDKYRNRCNPQKSQAWTKQTNGFQVKEA